MWAMDNWIYSANFNARFRYQGDGRFTREPTIRARPVGNSAGRRRPTLL
jgi:hypothetical protein